MPLLLPPEHPGSPGKEGCNGMLQQHLQTVAQSSSLQEKGKATASTPQDCQGQQAQLDSDPLPPLHASHQASWQHPPAPGTPTTRSGGSGRLCSTSAGPSLAHLPSPLSTNPERSTQTDTPKGRLCPSCCQGQDSQRFFIFLHAAFDTEPARWLAPLLFSTLTLVSLHLFEERRFIC